jgi:hypothetical protein
LGFEILYLGFFAGGIPYFGRFTVTTYCNAAGIRVKVVTILK